MVLYLLLSEIFALIGANIIMTIGLIVGSRFAWWSGLCLWTGTTLGVLTIGFVSLLP